MVTKMTKLSKLKRPFALGAFLLLASAAPAFAEEAAKATMTDAIGAYSMDNMFLFIAAVLVIFMQAGFALVETGLNAAKNSVNILFKNLIDFCVACICYYAFGYSIMYATQGIVGTGILEGGFFGFNGFGISSELSGDAAAAVRHPQADWLFQVAFAGTAATIVSGSVAGRLQFRSYLIYSIFISAIVYPVSGFWQWGGGWLNKLGFHDFAGSIVVHTVGGFAGLAGAMLLGPRIGRFAKDGTPKAMPGHSLALATLGVFILLIGWYGFNPGSQLAFYGTNNIQAVMLVAVNTTLAAAAGAIASMILDWVLYGKPDLTMTLNGMLAGLVAITANCDAVTNNEAIVIGLIGGVLVVAGVKLLDKLKIDDPVGAWPVHGLNGLWGGIATGIFADYSFTTQLIGSLVIAAWSFVMMLGLFGILKALKMLRVSEEEELKGLDISEHGEEGYAGFQVFITD